MWVQLVSFWCWGSQAQTWHQKHKLGTGFASTGVRVHFAAALPALPEHGSNLERFNVSETWMTISKRLNAWVVSSKQGHSVS
jgi:hypothetical protein